VIPADGSTRESGPLSEGPATMPMTGRRKIVVVVACAVGVVLLLGVAAVVLAPRWINLESVRKRIETAASSALGGEVTVERIELSFLPRPEVVIRKLELSGAGRVHGAIRSVSLSPVLRSLLRGRFRISTVRLDAPDLTIDIPEATTGEKPASRTDPLQSLTPLVASLASEASGLVVEIRGGRVAASHNGINLAVLAGLDVSVQVPPTGPRTVHADVRVSASSLSLQRTDRQVLQIAGLRIEGALDAGDGKTAVRLSRFSTESPGLRAEIALSADSAAPRVELTARGSGLGVAALRAKLVSFIGDDPTVAAIFAIFRAGTLTSFSFAAGGKTAGDLGIFERMSIQAVLADGSVRIGSVGLDLEEARGDVRIENAVLSVEHAAARIGKSRASEGSVRVGLAADDDTLRVEATVRSDLAELPGILSRAIRGGSFHEELSLVEDLAGSATARITIGDRAGALATKVSVSQMQLSGRYRRLPWPIRVQRGTFFYDGNRVGVTGLEARTGDAALRVSGVLGGLRQGPRKVEAAVDGETGPEAVRWIWEKASLPVEFLPPAPIALQEVRVGLAGAETLTLAGSFALRNGPRVTLDVIKDSERTDFRRLAIADALSDASISLGLSKTEFEVRFTGGLASETIEKLLPRKNRGNGRIEGDFHALVPRDHPGKTSAGGTLKATGFVIPTPAGDIRIESLDVRAAGNRLTASSSSLVLDEQHLSVTGDATLEDGGVSLDLDVATGGISWERVEKVLDRMNSEKKPAAATKEREPLSFPITGILRLSIDSFTYRDFAWKPVLADILLAKESVTATVRKAEVCGISTTGELQFRRGGVMSATARAASAGPDINAPLTCLGFGNTRMTGPYEVSLQVEGKGEASELPRALQGPLTFRASKGRIGKASLLTKILAVVNVTGLFKGKTRDRLGEAMSFDEFTVEGQVEDGRVSIREADLKSPSFAMVGSGALGYLDKSMDFTVLTHPFSTTDKIIQAIPVLRRILGKNFLAVAVKVTGNVDDPQIHLARRKDVGQGLVNIFARTVKLPVDVYDPPSR
jgi:hypothetical protein